MAHFWSAKIIGIATITFALASCGDKKPKLSALTHDAYVWQRLWTETVVESASNPPDEIRALMPLTAEIRFTGKGSETSVERVHPDYAATARLSGVVIRIDDSGAKTGWNLEACQAVETVCRDVLAEAPDVGELQIDYDCPVSKLSDYARLLNHLKSTVAAKPIELTFTALPAWLGDDFAAVAREADAFVLQVHSLFPPKPDKPIRLMDPAAAVRAADSAAKAGKPFRIALPTYSYYVAFDEDDRIVDVISEDLPSRWEPKIRYRLGWASPDDCADLITGWSKSRPALMTGIIWYRLPTPDDRMNWPESTLQIVMSGRQPESKLVGSLETSAEGYANVLLKNVGEQPAPLPDSFRVRTDSPIVAGDGGGLFAFSMSEDGSEAMFRREETNVDPLPLPVGKSATLGWIRMKDTRANARILIDAHD
ncbi:MAG: hypothetical protein ACI8UO_006400 [Verrucomicrobiales bacterium]|jgi:hypothetical protein